MASEVSFTAKRRVELLPLTLPEPGPGEVLVDTIASGISAGTEMTAFTGTNPYLHRTWDDGRRLFLEGGPTNAYPLRGWGYEEVGRIMAVGPDVSLEMIGAVVWGIWGHRSAGVLPAEVAQRQRLADDVPAELGIFARPGAVALNAFLDANARPGEPLVVFGQGVIGLLFTAIATAAGSRVIAVDPAPKRLQLSRQFGATETLSEPSSAAEAVRDLTDGAGTAICVELSGHGSALHESIRCVGLNGTVVAAGFYQGDLREVRLGEEFHHNRVRLVASQIGSVAPELSPWWSKDRVHREFMRRINRHQLDPSPLITHRFAAAQCQEAFDMLSAGSPDVLQAILTFHE